MRTPAASRLIACAVVLFAAALRSWRVTQGLPVFYEEAIPFRRALDMWTTVPGIDWNPHFFHYPSLTLYFNASRSSCR